MCKMEVWRSVGEKNIYGIGMFWWFLFIYSHFPIDLRALCSLFTLCEEKKREKRIAHENKQTHSQTQI